MCHPLLHWPNERADEGCTLGPLNELAREVRFQYNWKGDTIRIKSLNKIENTEVLR